MECVPSLTTHRLLAFALVIVCAGRVAAGQPSVASEINRQASGSFVFTELVPSSDHRVVLPSAITRDRYPHRVHHARQRITDRSDRPAILLRPDVPVLNAIVLAPQFSEEVLPSIHVYVRQHARFRGPHPSETAVGTDHH